MRGQIASPFRAVPYLTDSITRQGTVQPEFSPDRGQHRRRLAVHYYSFNIGDYRRDTSYLSLLEHGVYRQLLDTYYLSESPFPDDEEWLMRTHCARTADEMQALKTVLKDFFLLKDGYWHHKGCEKVIKQYRNKSEKAAASAKARWDKDANALRTQSEGNANHKPITNNHKPIKKIQAPEGVSSEVWDSFLAQRQKARAVVTETVIVAIKNEAAKAGWSLEQALTEITARGWRGFKAEWVREKEYKNVGDRNRDVLTGLTRGIVGGGNNVALLGK
jgi:uncharacterized protein YdaU (DUF1376 family)